MTSADDLRTRHDAIYSEPAVPEFRLWQLAPRLWAGRNPLSKQDLRELRARGVTHVLDLREKGEWAGPGRVGAEAVALAGEVGLERMHLPVGDFSPPSPSAFTQAAAWLDARFDEPEAVVFAHCRAGLQRTSTILAAWLARREGIAFGEAVQRLHENGYRGEPMAEQRRAAESWLASREGQRR